MGGGASYSSGARSASGGGVGGVGERVLTAPNALSLLRLVAVPLFLWAVLTRRDGLALLVVVVSGGTDYLDGKLARWLGQTSRVGQLLDPAADRLYILATLLGLSVRGIVPVWLALLLVARDLLLTATLAVLRRHGHGPLPVHFLGKVATFNLLYAFPLLLLGDRPGGWAAAADVLGWAFAVWGSALYWWAGALYVAQARSLLRPAVRRTARLPGTSA